MTKPFDSEIAKKVHMYLLNECAVARIESGTRLAEAEMLLKQALTLDEANGDVLYNLGLVYERAGAVEMAIGTYERCLNQGSGSHVPALVQLGNIAVRSGRTEDAEHFYQDALERDPTFF